MKFTITLTDGPAEKPGVHVHIEQTPATATENEVRASGAGRLAQMLAGLLERAGAATNFQSLKRPHS